MMDLVEFLRARIADDEAHAQKDLWALDRASAAGDWTVLYGYNLPRSIIEAGGDEVALLTAHREGLADGGEDQHVADAFLVSRMVRTARKRAERVLREVEAKRGILDLYERAWKNVRKHPDDMGSKGAALVMEGVVELLALPCADHPAFQQEWKP